jgi:hypothetical protein
MHVAAFLQFRLVRAPSRLRGALGFACELLSAPEILLLAHNTTTTTTTTR